MSRSFSSLEERLDFIEFRQQLLFTNSDLDRLIFEYEITQSEYRGIMDLMDQFRSDIEKGKSVSHGSFEDQMYVIVTTHYGDYHMCEYIARAFMDEGRWEEVFPALYGNMPKYQFLKDKNDN